MQGWKLRLLAVGLVIVAVLAGALLGHEAYAAPCCSSCEAGYNYCVSQCGSDPDCWWACDQQWDWCFSHCSFSC